MGQAEGGRGPMGVRTRDGDTTAMQPAAQMNAREKGEEPKRRSSSGSSGGTQRSKNGSTGPHPHRRTAASRSPSPGSACRALHGGMTPGAASARDGQVICRAGAVHPHGLRVGAWARTQGLATGLARPARKRWAAPSSPTGTPTQRRGDCNKKYFNQGECPLWGVCPCGNGACLLDPGLRSSSILR